MKLSRIACGILAGLICDDKSKYLYRTGKDLEKLFYGTGIDFNNISGNHSRKEFTIYCLENTDNIEKILSEITDYRIFTNKSKETAKSLVEEINDVLKVENHILVLGNNGLYKFQAINQHKIVKSELKKEVDILSIEYIEEHLIKMENKLKEKDYSGAVTNSKSLIEQIIRDLCKKLEVDFIDNDLGKAFKNIQSKMNMNPENYQLEGFKKILSGLINIVNGIAEVRNKTSDSHSRIYDPSEHHAVLCVNAARTFSNFIVASYLYQNKRGVL